MLEIGIKRLTPPILLAGLLAAGAGPLIIALGAQYLGGLEPCILCQYQRIPYWTVIGLAAAGLLVESADRRGIFLLAAAVFAAGAALAFYHVGVEQHWWASAANCGAGAPLPGSFEAFRATPLKPLTKACDEVDWTLFGLSMTVYNTAVSLFLAAASIFAASRMKTNAS
ncbi:MAG: disulfide bond formation protein B [Rhodospirillales bacterium]|jgi:disulfide bond formation protein DsbB|nr:disulfide bond formation protein B [Rhodospirillales bacterium]MDP6642705.1 disulfide bond formation protein B [Rhodospirillales bacterium]MDP6843871.1 disulfide bond formation protein B [Rhodospirillales bacterium]|tara:strand:- start:482 stop:988 length:507 start_codon:yes stop_codon:yes gene_type:complete